MKTKMSRHVNFDPLITNIYVHIYCVWRVTSGQITFTVKIHVHCKCWFNALVFLFFTPFAFIRADGEAVSLPN